MDGGEVTSLDLVQHGLAGEAEDLGSLVQSDPALEDFGDDTVADGLVDPDRQGAFGVSRSASACCLIRSLIEFRMVS